MMPVIYPMQASFCSYIFLVHLIHDWIILGTENRLPLIRFGASMVWHIPLSLINAGNFNKAKTYISPCKLCFLLFPVFFQAKWYVYMYIPKQTRSSVKRLFNIAYYTLFSLVISLYRHHTITSFIINRIKTLL